MTHRVALFAMLTLPATAHAELDAGDHRDMPFAIQVPAAPEPPATINRDAAGSATIRAVRIAEPLRIDGRLDESVYGTVPPLSGFTQTDPQEGAPPSIETEVWFLFDDENVYVVCRCWESEPERMIANEMRRDSSNIPSNDQFAFLLDTFYDRRNGVIFEVTPIGGRLDAQITNEQAPNTDWNPVWEVETGRFDGGWTVEARIPFRSLRYRPGTAQVWGFQVRRMSRSRNEVSYLTPIPASVGWTGHFRSSLAATVVGLEAPPGGRNLDIKPYAISSLVRDAVQRPPDTSLDGDVGLDVRYGLGQNIAVDLTYNTDFAQVEADEQQVNLSRFSLFFPEKREFFLENRGLFDFGGGGGNTPTLFYSRRIGLDDGELVPIRGGGRLTGRMGTSSVGVLHMQTADSGAGAVPGEAGATGFSVVRLRRDVLRRSSVGALFTRRSGAFGGNTYGVDGVLALADSVAVNAYWAKTEGGADGTSGGSYRALFNYSGDRYGLQLERLGVGRAFTPAVGFVPRPDVRLTSGTARFSPRPVSLAAVRRLSWTGGYTHIENTAGELETRRGTGSFAMDLENGDQVNASIERSHERLAAPLPLVPGVSVAPGDYRFSSVRAGASFGPQRQLASGSVSIEHGSFYGGTKTTLTVTRGRLNFPPHVSIEPTYSLNRVDVAEGRFTLHLTGARLTYTVTPRMFASALVQHNSVSRALSANVRFRWEYRPGSELFVVFNEQRGTLERGLADPVSRGLVLKVNRLFRF